MEQVHRAGRKIRMNSSMQLLQMTGEKRKKEQSRCEVMETYQTSRAASVTLTCFWILLGELFNSYQFSAIWQIFVKYLLFALNWLATFKGVFHPVVIAPSHSNTNWFVSFNILSSCLLVDCWDCFGVRFIIGQMFKDVCVCEMLAI